MKKVYLHGDLAKGIRSEWDINVKTPMEAVRAINVNTLGKLVENIYSLSSSGAEIGFACLSKEEIASMDKINESPVEDESLVIEFLESTDKIEFEGEFEEIHIAPAISGSFVITPTLTAAFIAKTIFVMVAGMLIAGIAAALFPPVKVNNTTRTTKSYAFADRPNIRRQGGPIPVGYGMLRVGSITSSFSRRNKFIPQSIDSGVIESFTSFTTHDLISEGPIEGFCDSNGNAVAPYQSGQYERFDKNPLLKSIYINDVKLMNDQGELNVIPNERVEGQGGETQPVFSLGLNPERMHNIRASASKPVYGIDYEKKGQSPLMGPDGSSISGFSSDVKKSGASSFTYAVSDRNVGILTLNISSERMFYNWTDKRVRRRLIGRKITVDQGTAAEYVTVALRVFDGKNYTSVLDVRGGDQNYSQLEDIEQNTRQNYTKNFRISNVLGKGQRRGRMPLSDKTLSNLFLWNLFEVLLSKQYHFSNNKHPDGACAAYKTLAEYAALTSTPSDQNEEYKGWYDLVYEKPLKNKIFEIVNSGQDFVSKFKNAWDSGADVGIPGIAESKTLKEWFTEYFDNNKRISYEGGISLVVEGDARTFKSAEVLGALSSQLGSNKVDDIFENNFHLCMSYLKLNLDSQKQTLGNDGFVYLLDTEQYMRYSGIQYTNDPPRGIFGKVIRKLEGWKYHHGKRTWYRYTGREYINKSMYENRNIKQWNNGVLVDSLYIDDPDNPWEKTSNKVFKESHLYVRGISTSPASIDFNIQLPYIAEGQSLTLQMVRTTAEIGSVEEQQKKQRRLSLKGIRQHKTLAGKRIDFASPCTSWISTEFDSVNFQQIPDRSYLVKLKKVAVPSNYNKYTGSCIGVWNGLFRGQGVNDKFANISESDLVWTQNPAWILLDILTNTRFGVGKSGLTAEQIDIWNLYGVAKFCDELVETGFPNERPVRKFITDNETPQDKKALQPAQTYISSTESQNSDYWDQFSKAKTFDIFIVDENEEKIPEDEFDREFNDGGYGNVVGEASGNQGKCIAFFMEDGSVDRRIIKKVNKENRSITLFGPGFAEHSSTEPVSDSNINQILKENIEHSQGILRTVGKCVKEVSYPMVEPRFSMNTLYTEQESALDTVRELTSAFRTVLNYMNGQISFSPETLQEPVMLFTDANVHKQGFAYAGASKSSRTTVAKVTYVDKFDDFKSKVEYFEDPSGIEKFGYIEQDIVGIGCTSRGQAQRLARFSVVAPLLESEVVSFKCGIEGSMLFPGAIIEISDSRRFGQNVNGRIKKIDKAASTVFIDKIVSNVQFYDPVTDRDNDRVELCVASPQGFEDRGSREKNTGLYSKMSELAGSSTFDHEDQKALIDATKKSQIIYFDGFLSSNRRKVTELTRKYKFSVKALAKKIISVNHGLNNQDKVQFISFGVLPTISFDDGSTTVSRAIESSDIFDVEVTSNHSFKVNLNGNQITFEDVGFVARDQDVSGGEHFYYINSTLRASSNISDTEKSLDEISIGSTWAIRGYRREFYGELERQAQSLSDSLQLIGAESIPDSNNTKYYHPLFGVFTVTKLDSVTRSLITINQSNDGGGLGGFTISLDPDGDFLREESPGAGRYNLVDHHVLGYIRIFNKNNLFVENKPGGVRDSLNPILHFYRPSLESGILRYEGEKNSALDYVMINGDSWKVHNIQTTTGFDNYIELDDRINGPTLTQITKTLNKKDGEPDTTTVSITIEKEIVYDINDYRNVGRRQYRINSISEEDGMYDIKASEYNREKFGIIEKALSLNRPSLPIPPQVNMSIPKAPSDVEIKDLTYRNE